MRPPAPGLLGDVSLFAVLEICAGAAVVLLWTALAFWLDAQQLRPATDPPRALPSAADPEAGRSMAAPKDLQA